MPYNSRADVCRRVAERYDTKSYVKLGGFRSQFEASYVSSLSEKLSYNETVFLYIYIYIYIYIIIIIIIGYTSRTKIYERGCPRRLQA